MIVQLIFFVDQLSVIENLITCNRDYHIIAGGDFNVDISETRFTLQCLIVLVKILG